MKSVLNVRTSHGLMTRTMMLMRCSRFLKIKRETVTDHLPELQPGISTVRFSQSLPMFWVNYPV